MRGELAVNLLTSDVTYGLSQRLALPLVTADDKLVRSLSGTGLDVRFLGEWPAV
jgi:hypothetical protein